MLIINADDWGRSRAETDIARTCFQRGRLTSVSAMVFMEDSERAAELARGSNLAIGLHFNLTEKFSAPPSDPQIMQSHARVARFLKRNKYAALLYHPLLGTDFRRLWQAQLQEFERLYGRPPDHADGHQHMHLAANMWMGRILPRGLKIRRNFSFFPGEKNLFNRGYRKWIDHRLARRHGLTDYFFCLSQSLKRGRLAAVFELARNARVELMTHPVRELEQEFLLSPAMGESLQNVITGTYAQI